MEFISWFWQTEQEMDKSAKISHLFAESNFRFHIYPAENYIEIESELHNWPK